MSFLSAYVSLGVILPGDRYDSLPIHSAEGQKTLSDLVESQAVIMATRCVLDAEFKHFPCSTLACALLYQSRKDCGLEPAWCPELTALTGHDPFKHLIVRQILQMFEEEEEEEGVECGDDESPETRDSQSDCRAEQEADDCLLRATRDMSFTSPRTPTTTTGRGPSPTDLRTPLQNKENGKPALDETSPVSITNMALA